MEDGRLTPDDSEFGGKFADLKALLSSADEFDENALVAKIETALSDLDAGCRKIIGEYLGTLTEKEEIARAFLNIASHPEDKHIRSLAIASLGYLKYEDAIQMLADLAVSEEGRKKEYDLHACQALGNIGTKESGEALLKHLEHARDWTKIDIVDALIKIGHPNFVEPLLKHHVSNVGAIELYIAMPIANFVGLEKYLSADVSDESYRGAVEILYAIGVVAGGPGESFLDHHNPALLVQNFVNSTKLIAPRWWMVVTALRIIALLKHVPKWVQAHIDEATIQYGEKRISKESYDGTVSYFQNHLETVKPCLPYLDALTEYAEAPSSLEGLAEGLVADPHRCTHALDVLPNQIRARFQEISEKTSEDGLLGSG